jgi:hypothetical protein
MALAQKLKGMALSLRRGSVKIANIDLGALQVRFLPYLLVIPILLFQGEWLEAYFGELSRLTANSFVALWLCVNFAVAT